MPLRIAFHRLSFGHEPEIDLRLGGARSGKSALAQKLAAAAEWIVVSSEVGWANQRLAAAADEGLFLVAGLPWMLKPAR